ncbi:MAG: nuclear transport factor 2 family protein [bacterium]|nr:nuclear transport factor 2 family protein [bacterium]
MDAVATAKAYVRAINDLDNDQLYKLMSEDFRFIDSEGGVHPGRSREMWPGYWSIVPDYRITISEVHVTGNIVVLLGEAGGTYTPDGELRKEDYWETPVALRAVVESSLIKEWRVYADNEPIRVRTRAHGTL